MRIVGRLFGICGLLALTIVGFTNFDNVEIKKMVPKSLKQPEKQYVQIHGKFYEKNESGIYHIDGVPTFVKRGKPDEPKPAAKNPRLGPPIDPNIYKDALGLQGDEHF